MIFYSMHCTSFQLSVNIRDNWDKYNPGLTTPIKSIPIKAICDDTYMACSCSDYSSHTVFHWLAKSPSSHSTSWDQMIQPSFMKRKFQNIGAPLSSLVEWLFDVYSHQLDNFSNFTPTTHGITDVYSTYENDFFFFFLQLIFRKWRI